MTASMFELSKNEQTRIDEWAMSHDCDTPYVGAIGGRVTYCFTPTGLGVCTVAKCACGKDLDVTEYEGW